jgi:hypothetical protein
MVCNEVFGISLGNIESLGFVLGSGDGILLGDLLLEGLGDPLGCSFGGAVLSVPLGRRLGWSLGYTVTLANEVFGISLGNIESLGRSLGDTLTLGNDVPGISLGKIETLGYALGSDDGLLLGDLIAEGFGDLLGRTYGNAVIGISLGLRLGRPLGDTVTLGNDVLGISLGKRYALGSDDGLLLGDLLAEGLGDPLGSTFGGAVLIIPLGLRLGRPLGDTVTVGNALLDIPLDNFESLGYALGSDDGSWLGDLLAEGLGDPLGRSFDGEVLGASLGRRLERSLGDTVTLSNDVLGISLGKIESLGYALGSNDGFWLRDLLSEGLGDTVGRSFGSDVLGISLRLSFSIKKTTASGTAHPKLSSQQ